MLMRCVMVLAVLCGCCLAEGQQVKPAGEHSESLFGQPEALLYLNHLLSLNVDRAGRLSLAREVWDQHGWSMQERVDWHMSKLLERMPESMRNERTIEHLKLQVKESFFDSLTDVFYEFGEALLSGGTRGAGGYELPDGYSLHQYGDSASLEIASIGETRIISLGDREPDGWTVDVIDSPPELIVTIEGPDNLARLQQTAESITVMMVEEDWDFTTRAENWSDFVAQNPDQYQTLMAALASCGFVKPVMLEDDETGKCVMSCLAMLGSEKVNELEQLLTELTAEQQEVRQAAAEKLEAIADQVHYQLECLLDESDDRELQEQLAAIVQSARRNLDHDIRYLTLVRRWGLCDSPRYLTRLAAGQDPFGEEAVFQRLTELTGESFGTDVEAWQQWISRQPAVELETSDTVVPSEAAAVAKDVGFEQEPFEKIKDTLADILCLQVDAEGRISLERNSWLRNSPTFEELLEKEIQRYSEFRFDRGDAEATARRRLGDKMSPGIALEALLRRMFEQTGSHSFGKSGAGEEFRAAVGGQVASLICEQTPQRLDLAIRGNSLPRRRVRVLDDRNRDQFRLSADDGQVYLRILQSPVRCQVMLVEGSAANRSVFPSFSEFAIAEPEQARIILDVMWQSGIDAPPTLDCPRVREFVVAQLNRENSETGQRFAALLQKLDSDQFALRQEAREQLRQDYREFLPLIDKELEGSLTPETRKTLREVQAFAAGQGDYDRRFGVFAASHRLLESPEFLIGILPQLSEAQQKNIYDHLKQITGTDPGDNIEAWSQWLQEQTQDDD